MPNSDDNKNVRTRRPSKHKDFISNAPSNKSISRNDSRSDTDESVTSMTAKPPKYQNDYFERSENNESPPENVEENQSQFTESDTEQLDQYYQKEYRRAARLDIESERTFENLVEMLGQKIRNVTSVRSATNNSRLLEETMWHHCLYMDFIKTWKSEREKAHNNY